jgi:hypothetical protein
MTARNECLDVTLRELRAAGVHNVALEHGRHIKVRFTLDGKERHIVVAVSPSDHRARTKARSFARRFLRVHALPNSNAPQLGGQVS